MCISIGRVCSWAAVAVLASTGLMQGGALDTFHLSTEAHWGSAVLPPGDYTIVLPSPSPDQTKLRINGGGKTVFELPVVISVQKDSDSNRLKLVNVDGEYFIREFSSGATGETYTFAVPKPNQRRLTTSQ